MSWIKEGKRLVFYGEVTDPAFWAGNWQGLSTREAVDIYEKDDISNEVFQTYLPKDGRILEAGCGLAPWVVILQRKNYNIEGIDFDAEAINRVKREFDPNLPIKVGNVLDLPYPDNFFDGYISIGVVEHFKDGPERALKEAYRVLRRGGILIVSVPYFNPLRRFKSWLGYYKKNQGGDFHEYVFSKNEFSNILTKSGFALITTRPHSALKTIKDEIAPAGILIRFLTRGSKYKEDKEMDNRQAAAPGGSKRLRYYLYLVARKIFRKVAPFLPLESMAGHMLIFVAEKRV